MIDKSPEITGLKGFKNHLKNIPEHPLEAIEFCLSILNLKESGAAFYMQRVLMNLNGWCGYAAKIDYEAKLENKKTDTVLELLAVLVSWELAAYLSLKNSTLEDKWLETVSNFEKIEENNILIQKVYQNLILQEALNYAVQRNLITKFNTTKKAIGIEIPKADVQAIFCIDVRSEVYRRNLEQTSNKIQTLGFAGFFGFPVNFFRIGKQQSKAQSPVLLKPGLKIYERIKENVQNQKVLNELKLKEDITSLWKTFKSGSISSFVFVSPLGLLYIPKLIFATFKLPHFLNGLNFIKNSKNAPSTIVSLKSENEMGIPLETQIEMAKNALTAMSLTENFGKLVLLVGHGSSTTNNPYGSALHCGACG